ncbi:hypothetical protein FHS83_000578 [Rhizomicrobium palustre]|uniref:Uncharacterized protein n=1 Tax=Rhizomicrobium palustre TaxID=189966 RepID=A0A846MW45_9PROT|nr:hypothetical protein [Rhizomicrobium palustre]NIK87260.1 hypothetical protein [Rhizomicrobium palustre]
MSEHQHTDVNLQVGRKRSMLQFLPYFLPILILYVLLETVGIDLKKVYGQGGYTVTWGEILLILSAVMALAEQLKVSNPGIDNTLEALTMVGMGVLQLVLFVLGAAGVVYFGMFAKSDFLVQTFISLSASIVAVLINARTLRRSIDFAGN